MIKEVFKQYLLSFCGLPYIWGGNNPVQGFDCSGIVLEFLHAVGVYRGGDINALGIYNFFHDKDLATPQYFGDLLFFGKSKIFITHIAIALDETYMVEAGGGSQLSTTPEMAGKIGAFVRIRPINHRKDLVAACRPEYPWEKKDGK
jgi:cell wall-associated NlpC family hydrolase